MQTGNTKLREFDTKQGLRQGVNLSPTLFIIMMIEITIEVKKTYIGFLELQYLNMRMISLYLQILRKTYKLI